MAHADPRVRGSRAIVVTAVVLMLAGTCGAGNSIVQLRGEATVGSTALLPSDASLETVEANRAVDEAMARAAREAPFARALDAANVALSVMLIVGAVLLILLRKSAPWWVTQATLANALWTAAFAASHVVELSVRAPELRARLLDLEQALAADPHIRDAGMPFDPLTQAVGVRIAVALATIGFYAWIGLRIRRPDVRSVLEDAERHRR